ncbi:MAG: Bax inhibitor-1/YccA family protein [Treponemataceae bacterium]
MEDSVQKIALKDADASLQHKFISQVYLWMAGALLLSGAMAFFVANSEVLLRLILGNKFVFFGILIAEFILVGYFSSRIRYMSVKTAFVVFLLYSLLNGVTLSVIFLAYTASSIAYIFLISALMFGAMSVFGATTKINLTSIGRYLSMAIIGIVIASLANIFLKSSRFDWVISIISVVVFTGLTAYDTQKILALSIYADDSDGCKKAAVYGALELYLDFINLFLRLLRLFGKRRD